MVFAKGMHLRRLALAGVLLHTIFLAAADFEHHDIACHLKTPLHCTSCALSQVGSDPHSLVVPGAFRLADAGRAVAWNVEAESAVLTVRTTGRSPPALA
jgi:hypothetical protein